MRIFLIKKSKITENKFLNSHNKIINYMFRRINHVILKFAIIEREFPKTILRCSGLSS